MAFLIASNDLIVLIPPLLLGGYATWMFWPRDRRRPFKPIGEGRYLLEEEE